MIKTPRPSPASAAWSSDSEDRGWRSSVHVTGASDAARALVVHHRDGLGVGPRAYDQTNLVVLCRSCHNDEYGLVHRRAPMTSANNARNAPFCATATKPCQQGASAQRRGCARRARSLPPKS
jgi:hypothetical protein